MNLLMLTNNIWVGEHEIATPKNLSEIILANEKFRQVASDRVFDDIDESTQEFVTGSRWVYLAPSYASRRVDIPHRRESGFFESVVCLFNSLIFRSYNNHDEY